MPSWPINEANISMQAFVMSDLRDNPLGYGSVLERYFLGSSGERAFHTLPPIKTGDAPHVSYVYVCVCVSAE